MQYDRALNTEIVARCAHLWSNQIMDLTQAVRELRTLTGETQQSFAQRLGLSLRAINNYEKDRAPNSPALFRLAKLARQVGRLDLAQVFSSALSAELQEVVEPMTKEERIWSSVVLALVRDRQLTDWPRIGGFLVKALEKVARQKDAAEAKELEPVLVEARYSLTSTAEIELEELAKAQQIKTGQAYYQAYSEVLLHNPELYNRYLQERAAAARGTSIERTMATPRLRKRSKSKSTGGKVGKQ
jgi:transcriptional regulator with XRE-family HTH domain